LYPWEHWDGIFIKFILYIVISITILQVSANLEPEASALNQNDEKHETPISLSEDLKKDGANDVICSKDEVQTNDQTNGPISNFELTRHDTKFDAPNYNTEFQKPAASESVLCLSNQGMK